MSGAQDIVRQAPAEEAVLIAREGAVAILTLNRPEAANSIDAPLARAMREAVEALDRDPSVRALVIEGAGKMFCGGGDLASFAKEERGAAAYVEGLIADLHAALQALETFHAPVIAAVHGAAAGAGLGIAMAADLVVAGAGSRFVMAYTRSGLTPDGGTSWLLPRLVGLRRALELTLTNPTLSAAEALDAGLVTEVVPDAGVGERARILAAQLADGPTAAYATARRLLRAGLQTDYGRHLADEATSIVGSFTTEDGLEGVRAFHERRRPRFHGR
jgi:2-(1,2-epoxy-1,2-dihydrophenyl)acetyl-CoA isomerase